MEDNKKQKKKGSKESKAETMDDDAADEGSSSSSLLAGDLMAGYLKKQGPPHRPTWNKRWVVLTKDRKISYYKQKANDEKKREKFLKGDFPLDRSAVLVLQASDKKKFELSFGIKTPDRNFVFLASDERDKEKWTTAISKVMSEIRDEIKQEQTKMSEAKEKLKASIKEKERLKQKSPNNVLPTALLNEIFFRCDVKEVATVCSLTCKNWYASANSDPLWERLSKVEFAMVFSKGEDSSILKKSEKLSANYPRMCAWKRFFVWGVLSRKLLSWDTKYHPDMMLVSSDRKTVTHTTEKSTHRDCYTTLSFTSGVHRWKVRVDNLLEENGYWAAVGVSDLPIHTWVYGTKHHWGLSSEGVVQNGPETSPLPKWKNGDEVTLLLNHEAGTLEISLNDKPMVTHRVPSIELWPWVNIFQAGTSVTFVP